MAKQSPEINLAGLKILKNSKTLLYNQVYALFREMILKKRLRSGDRLPSTRSLAITLGVSRTIIIQSFEQLILEGYLIAKTGSGTFIAPVLPDQLMTVEEAVTHKQAAKKLFLMNEGMDSRSSGVLEFISNREEIVPFIAGIPSMDFFPYKTWANVATKVIKKMKSFHLGYESTLGYYPLRKAIASYLRITRGVKCESEQVIVVSGSQQGLNIIVQSLLKEGNKVWMEDPGYQGARLAFIRAGIKICPAPIEIDGISIDYLKKHCLDTKLGFITPSHQYPLGVTLSLSKRLELLSWASENNMWIFEDDYDSEYRYEGKPLASLQGLDTSGVVIYTGTFSKVLFPGLRLGYMVLPSAEMVEQIKKIKVVLDRQSPIIDQVVLSRFMEEGHFLRHIRKMRLLYASRQSLLLKLVNENLSKYIEMSPAASGMNLIGWLSPKINVTKLKEQVIQQGLTIAFLEDYTIEHFTKPAISLGYTAFSNYRLKMGIEKLSYCIEKSLKL